MDNQDAYTIVTDARKDGLLQSHTVTDTIREAGIITLTGEACALSQRVLCDLTNDGVDLMTQYWGLPPGTQFKAKYNHRDGQVASCFIDRDAFTSIAIFYLRVIKNRSVAYLLVQNEHSSSGSIYSMPPGSHDLYRALVEYMKGGGWEVQSWYKGAVGEGSQPRRGASNVHAMSGRSQ